jgi:hypothetical protein
MNFYLTIQDEKLVCHHGVSTTGFEKRVTPIESQNDLIALLAKTAVDCGIPEEDLTVMSSSSLDFADEYTSDPAVLELVEWVNEH